MHEQKEDYKEKLETKREGEVKKTGNRFSAQRWILISSVSTRPWGSSPFLFNVWRESFLERARWLGISDSFFWTSLWSLRSFELWRSRCIPEPWTCRLAWCERKRGRMKRGWKRERKRERGRERKREEKSKGDDEISFCQEEFLGEDSQNKKRCIDPREALNVEVGRGTSKPKGKGLTW